MNKFGLLDEEPAPEPTFAERLTAFPAVKPRSPLDISAMDAAAAQHGFISREAAPGAAQPHGRRRRAVPAEPTRHLAIRLPASGYDRFVAYADSKRLTYHDALLSLLDSVGN